MSESWICQTIVEVRPTIATFKKFSRFSILYLSDKCPAISAQTSDIKFPAKNRFDKWSWASLTLSSPYCYKTKIVPYCCKTIAVTLEQSPPRMATLNPRSSLSSLKRIFMITDSLLSWFSFWSAVLIGVLEVKFDDLKDEALSRARLKWGCSSYFLGSFITSLRPKISQKAIMMIVPPRAKYMYFSS